MQHFSCFDRHIELVFDYFVEGALIDLCDLQRDTRDGPHSSRADAPRARRARPH